ncbi:hypothetical protein MPTK1_3g16720 [Marchantia polymorpha subsp. ruderalis]
MPKDSTSSGPSCLSAGSAAHLCHPSLVSSISRLNTAFPKAGNVTDSSKVFVVDTEQEGAASLSSGGSY